jgi:TolA-binding protein
MSSRFTVLLAAPAVALLLASSPAVAQATGAPASDNTDAQIRELREHVKKLEARLAELEKQVKPLVAQRGGAGGGAEAGNDAKPAAAVQPAARNEALVRQAQVKARARMRQDARKHSSEEIGSAEELYQVANKNWRTEQARQSLQQMVEKFPDVNRTGCAVLYLGQMSVGEERERLLTDAIEKYGDCYYGNGVNVGAYARFLLAHYYKENGEADKAKKLFNDIRTKYADAVDHGGRSLVAQLQAAEAGNGE